jgi:hypothetical protein
LTAKGKLLKHWVGYGEKTAGTLSVDAAMRANSSDLLGED